jgi:hypothetical protein
VIAMIFTLEVFKAKYGEAFLLHFGELEDRRVLLVDGGPRGSYDAVLRPRLEQLRHQRGGELDLDLVIIGHADEDHYHGFLELTDELLAADREDEPVAYVIDELWHNGVDELVGEHAELLLRSARAEQTKAGSTLSHRAALLLASELPARRLVHNVEQLGLHRNRGGILITDRVGEHQLAHGLTLRVLAPRDERIDALQQEWDAEVKRRGVAEAEQGRAHATVYLDESLAALASLVLVVELEGKRMLLAGDAGGDELLEALQAGGMLDDDGRAHFDLFKMPQHGAAELAASPLLERVSADHYVIAADGKHGQPAAATLEALIAASQRREGGATLWLATAVQELAAHWPEGDRDGLSRVRELLDACAGATSPLRLRAIGTSKSSFEIALS